MRRILFCFLIFICVTISLYPTIINIPEDQPTIQDGIDSSAEGDTVLVEPGTYVENINYNGKNITVGSLFLITQDTTYISQTIIDGNQNGSVVTFENGEDSTAVLIGFTVTHGNTNSYSGGITIILNSSPTVSYVNICDNYSDNGGGIYISSLSSPKFNNINIHHNSSQSRGGGLCLYSASATLSYLSIYENTSPYGGGGIYSDNSELEISHMTMCNNDCPLSGGLENQNSDIIINNSIIWNNMLTNILNNGNNLVIEYSDIQSGFAGTGNIDEDPLFENLNNNNFHLTEYSPCIDAGNPNMPVDPDETISDMGAYYFCQGIHANFEANPVSGYNPLLVHFSDLSVINITSWEWDFNNDGIIDSYTQNPNFTYNQSGIYSVSLTVSDGTNEDTMIREDYITILEPLNCDFEAVPLNGPQPLEVYFTDLSTGNPNVWLWDFDNDGFIDSNEQNPTYVYENVGIYTVYLKVLDGNNEDTETKVDYIEVNVNGSQNNIIPNQIQLFQNYPNPFNPSAAGHSPTTTIEFSIKKDSDVEIAIYSTKGQKIKTLIRDGFTQGSHSIIWDGHDKYNNPVSSGIYYYKLTVNGKTEAVKKCLLLK